MQLTITNAKDQAVVYFCSLKIDCHVFGWQSVFIS